MDTGVGEEGEGEVYGESNTEIYISHMNSFNYLEWPPFLHNSFLKF